MFKKICIISLCLAVLASCGDSEKDARKLFNEALVDWRNQKFEEAIGKFDLLSTKYKDTAVTTEALLQRKILLEQYKQANDSKNREVNKGYVGRRVIMDLNDYYREHNRYPDNLTVLKIPEEEYTSLCRYSIDSLKLGYNLDCAQAEAAYQEDREAGMARNQSISSSSPVPLDAYPKVEKTWGDTLNPSGKLPATGFAAFYINTKNPRNVIYQETVNDISISYPYSEFHGIKSEDFGGYWVGKLRCAEKAPKEIAINQSSAKTRLMIDKHIVYYEGGSNRDSNKIIPFTCDPGDHLVEVEYVNNWPETQFSLRIMDKTLSYRMGEIAERLKTLIDQRTEILFAGVYESARQDMSLQITLKKNDNPQVIFLNSYRPVKWVFQNPDHVNVRAIVYHSYSPGTVITGDVDAKTVILATNEPIDRVWSRLFPQCACFAGNFNCEEGSLEAVQKAVEKATKAKLTAFSIQHSASSLVLPETLITPDFLNQMEKVLLNNKQLRDSCAKKANPDFDTMFQKEQGGSSLTPPDKNIPESKQPVSPPGR